MSDPETSIAQKKSKKKSTASKNEGDDPHWAYAPQEGAVLLDHALDAGPFDYDALKDDDDTEIWLIRAPDALKPKHLATLSLSPPSSSRTARIGALAHKTAAYDVWSVGDDDAEVQGAEELRGLACLLPRRRKRGRLCLSPKEVSHHIVICAQPSVATPPEGPVVYRNPPRPSYPKEVLKHAFVPYGARSQQSRSEDASIDVDDLETTREKPASDAPKETPAKSKESKSKKRKVEGASPKKSKKHKSDG